MNIFRTFFLLAVISLLPIAAHAQLNGPQGGTGVKGIYAGSIPFGGTSLLRMSTSSAFTFNAALQKLTVTNASTTAFSSDEICLGGECNTSWPTVTGTFSTTSSTYWAQNALQLGQISDVSTSSLSTNHLLYWTGTEWSTIATSSLGITGAGTVTSVAQTVPTGLTITGSPVTTTGTLAIGFDTGYSLPKTASTTEGSTAYTWGNHATYGYQTAANVYSIVGATTTLANLTITESQISNLDHYTDVDTATYISGSSTVPHIGGNANGDVLYWTGTAWAVTATSSWDTNTTYTAGDALTLTGTDIDFDGGATPAGGLGGTWANPTVDSDGTWTGHNSYPSACSAGEYVSAIGDTLTCGTPASSGATEPIFWLHNGTDVYSSSTVAVPSISATSTTASSTFQAVTATAFGIVGKFFASATQFVVGTLAYFTGGVVISDPLIIPISSNPSVESEGELAINNTSASSSLRFHDGTAERSASDRFQRSLLISSSTIRNAQLDPTATTTIIIDFSDMGTLSHMWRTCKTVQGTQWGYIIGNGTASSTYVNCTATKTRTVPDNATFNFGDTIYLQMAPATTTVTVMTIGQRYDAD